jgi:hypothetical protein
LKLVGSSLRLLPLDRSKRAHTPRAPPPLTPAALHPEADDGPTPPAGAAPPPPRTGNAVLRALEEQTRRTVAEAGLQRPGGGGGGEGGEEGEEEGEGGGGDQVSAIMDVVMQHLLSKDVLYQPMKVGRVGGGGVSEDRGRGAALAGRIAAAAAFALLG